MDRHLIFPPGYKPPKSAPDGDMGPNMTIPGTGISLNTPDAIAAWIAERKKNWPTAEKIAEKKKRKAEAIERGQLEETRNKRQRIDGQQVVERSQRGRGRGRGTRGSHRGGGRGFGRANGDRELAQPGGQLALPIPTNPPQDTNADPEDGDTKSETESESDIDPSRDIISSKIRPPEHDEAASEAEQVDPHPTVDTIKPHKRKIPKQPQLKSYNPLVDRPSFLRKLLQPEIRHTVSSLSQAIRFIVENDMFNGVELKPGDAENVLIKEVQSAKAEREFEADPP